jgi:SAM-dependent methyltransferase
MVVEAETFYRKNQAVEVFSRVTGWQHPGEEVVLRQIAPLVRSKRILDVGIGGGRTVGLLTLLTDLYVGIDYSELMVAAAKKKYPNLDLRVGDARDLSDFDEGSFDFAYFSYDGIDTMDEGGRKAVLAASHRVLDKDGLFVFSTLSKDGPSFRESPFQLHRPGRRWDLSAAAAAHLAWRNAQDPLRIFHRLHNWREARERYVDHDGWGTSTMAVTNFTLMNHFVTLARLRQELAQAEFEVVAVYGSDQDSGPLSPDSTSSTDDSLYAVARRR